MSITKKSAPDPATGVHLSPPAKINLGLIIKGRRPDGYHLLETLLVPVPQLQDELSLYSGEDDKCQITLHGQALDGDPADNLCVRAWKALKEICPAMPGVHIHLTKHIPAGAGLGGGSSDAAYTLRGLNSLFDLKLNQDQLVEVAAGLGADVPFFLFDQPMMARGIGTDLTAFEIDLPYEIRLVTPPIHSGTIAAYKALNITHLDPDRDLAQILKRPITEWPIELVNDLEQPVFEMYPELPAIKDRLYAEGAVYAAMSGSGSAVFGLFPH